MSIIKTLKLTETGPVSLLEPKHLIRAKLLRFLYEQRSIAQADVEKRPYVATRIATRIDADGKRVREEVPKRANRAWFNNPAADGTHMTYFQLRYGNRPLALAKGKTSIEVGQVEQLPALIDQIIQAVHGGELDEILAAAAAERRANFKKEKKA